MLKSRVCVDPTIVIAIVTAEPSSRAALNLWEKWMAENWQPVAPLLFVHEVTSVLYHKSAQGEMTAKDSRMALQEVLNLDIRFIDMPGLSERAFELAAHFHRSTAYETQYLALAEHLNCPYWTADKQLYELVRSEFPIVQWLGNFHPRIV